MFRLSLLLHLLCDFKEMLSFSYTLFEPEKEPHAIAGLSAATARYSERDTCVVVKILVAER
jgi:hypothetical protein